MLQTKFIIDSTVGGGGSGALRSVHTEPFAPTPPAPATHPPQSSHLPQLRPTTPPASATASHRPFQHPQQFQQFARELRRPARRTNLVQRRRPAPRALAHPVAQPGPHHLKARNRERPHLRPHRPQTLPAPTRSVRRDSSYSKSLRVVRHLSSPTGRVQRADPCNAALRHAFLPADRSP